MVDNGSRLARSCNTSVIRETSYLHSLPRPTILAGCEATCDKLLSDQNQNPCKDARYAAGLGALTLTPLYMAFCASLCVPPLCMPLGTPPVDPEPILSNLPSRVNRPSRLSVRSRTGRWSSCAKGREMCRRFVAGTHSETWYDRRTPHVRSGKGLERYVFAASHRLTVHLSPCLPRLVQRLRT